MTVDEIGSRQSVIDSGDDSGPQGVCFWLSEIAAQLSEIARTAADEGLEGLAEYKEEKTQERRETFTGPQFFASTLLAFILGMIVGCVEMMFR
jgi:hypothetical protein